MMRENKGWFGDMAPIYFILPILCTVLILTGCLNKKEEELTNGKQINHESPIILENDGNYDKFITGQRNNKEVFQILLDAQTVSLNQVEFFDLTGDSRMEMCVGLDIANTAASDINAIHVYDSESLELLFPNENKSPVYDGKIVRLEEEGLLEYAIGYTSFAKTGGIAFPDEESLIGWRDDRFTVLRYKKKLMALKEGTAVFLKDYSCYDKAVTLKLSVEKIGDYEQNQNQMEGKIQDITVELEEDADFALIDKRIEGNDLVALSDIDADGELEIVIRPYLEDSNEIKEIIYDWNSAKGRFEFAQSLEDTDLSNWSGTYSYSLFYRPNIAIDVDLHIYKNNHIYYGYLQASGFQTFEQMTVLIRGNEKSIYIYAFDINPATGSRFQKGNLLFGLKRDGDKLLTKWEDMYIEEKTEKWEELFEYSRKSLWKAETVEQGDLQAFLGRNGFAGDELPFYQYYDDKGSLQIELYYDERTCSGAGFCSDLFLYNGFSFKGYYYGNWQDDKFSTDYNGNDGSSSVEDYVESCEYNKSYYDSRGRLEHVSSYSTHGSFEKYYIYQGESMEPSYCLEVDSTGGVRFIKYKLFPIIEAVG